MGGARVVTGKTTGLKAWVHFSFVLLIACLFLKLIAFVNFGVKTEILP